LPPEERDIAMVFQSHALYPHLTVDENLAFPLKLRGVNRADIAQKVDEITALLRLEGLGSRRPVELSGGEAQRVALGRALIRKPAALLMDEPLSSLPPDLRFRLRNQLRQIHTRERRPTLYVTHDHEEALALGDQVAVLHGGVIQQTASPRELYEKPANQFVAGFIGRPSMNFIPTKKEILGIRPEHLEICEPAEALFQTTIESVQYLGAFSDIAARFEQTQLVIRHFGSRSFSVGAPLPLRAAPENLHYFDPQTGNRIEP
jgi:ABC-type sugar transport system ATPase subunit